MRLSSIGYLIHDCFLNIRRNGLMSLAALGTVTMALTVLGASLWTAHRINEYAQRQPEKFNIVDVFLTTETERDKALALVEKIKQLANVGSVQLVTKEQAWSEIQSSDPSLTVGIESNPLPDKLEIETKDPSRVAILASTLRDKVQFPEVEKVNDAGQEVRTMLGFARMIRVIGGAAAIGLFIATLFIVQNTIRLTVYARRREIRTMQLVGATPGFIRLPLLLEGVFHGVVGALLASIFILLCGREVSRFVAALQSPLLSDVPSELGPRQVVIGLTIIGACVGLSGSYLSMRRFLKQI